MKCMRPIKAGYNQAGDITYSTTAMSKELDSFEFKCRKCLPCRLNIAREKAIRATHEAQCHDHNIFITLTYDEKHLESSRLIYKHWQDFIKRLREKILTQNIEFQEELIGRPLLMDEKKALRNRLYTPYMVTGEYGEKKQRPHWHAIIFNYEPHDNEYKYTTDLGEDVFTSKVLTETWGKGMVEYGSVTMESAGYVARYAAKKLVHGNDQEHDFHPIHKTSCKRAIGRSWIEKHYRHTFGNGFIILPNGSKVGIPRYYTDWLKKYHWDEYVKYVNNVQPKTIDAAIKKQSKEEIEHLSAIANYDGRASYPQTRQGVEHTILKRKFKQLQESLKL